MSTIEYIKEELEPSERIISRERVDRIIKKHHIDPSEYTGPNDLLDLYLWLGY